MPESWPRRRTSGGRRRAASEALSHATGGAAPLISGRARPEGAPAGRNESQSWFSSMPGTSSGWRRHAAPAARGASARHRGTARGKGRARQRACHVCIEGPRAVGHGLCNRAWLITGPVIIHAPCRRHPRSRCSAAASPPRDFTKQVCFRTGSSRAGLRTRRLPPLEVIAELFVFIALGAREENCAVRAIAGQRSHRSRGRPVGARHLTRSGLSMRAAPTRPMPRSGRASQHLHAGARPRQMARRRCCAAGCQRC